jgi:hypothetical protein
MLEQECDIRKDRGDKDMALDTNTSGRKEWKTDRSLKDIECFECHKKGHKRSDRNEKKSN